MRIDDVIQEVNEFLARPLFAVGGTEGTVGTGLIVLAIVIASIVFSRLLGRGILHALERSGTTDPLKARPYVRFVQSIILATGLAVAFNTLGMDLTAVFAAGGLAAVAFGFAMKNIAENFVSGLIMRLEKSIKHGDVVEVEGQIVQIRDVGVRFTLARSLDEEDILIPNSILVQSLVTNRSMHDSLFRLRALVGVTYSSDMKLVRETLERIAADIKWRVGHQDPVVLLRQFGSSSVDFEVSVWIDQPWSAQRRLSDLNEAIWWAFQEAGIVIAFPQLDLHLDRPVMESLQGLRRAG